MQPLAMTVLGNSVVQCRQHEWSTVWFSDKSWYHLRCHDGLRWVYRKRYICYTDNFVDEALPTVEEMIWCGEPWVQHEFPLINIQINLIAQGYINNTIRTVFSAKTRCNSYYDNAYRILLCWWWHIWTKTTCKDYPGHRISPISIQLSISWML